MAHLNLSFVDAYGSMSVKCKNIRCKHCDDNNMCYLFKISINEKGQCASFEEASGGSHK